MAQGKAAEQMALCSGILASMDEKPGKPMGRLRAALCRANLSMQFDEAVNRNDVRAIVDLIKKAGLDVDDYLDDYTLDRLTVNPLSQ
jgi:hypothetical protein